jgi:murein DD-endopeptidase MepM/ murein hydrolase activator NlpD
LSKHYTKANLSAGGVRLARLVSLLALMAALGAPPVGAQAPFPTDYSDWHLPLPAGQWVISRGPCNVGPFHHQCGYYEDHCAIDLTSAAGSMERVPVLAPQDGQVFFVGTRADSGLAVLLEHPDGRVSALMHLSRVVVAPDQRVTQGQVVAYAGNTGSSGRAHLHFHVQPNTVERNCVPLDGLDEINLPKATATSFNLPWTSLALTDPPADLPAWLTHSGAAVEAARLPARLVLAPRGRVRLPIAIPAGQLAAASVFYGGQELQPVTETPAYSVFNVDVAAPLAPGEYIRLVQLRPTGAAARTPTLRLRLSVRPAPATSPSDSIVFISPTFVGPANYSEHPASPRLCWSVPAVAGRPPLRFRAMVVGPQPADSGWIDSSCWQAPPLPNGTYYWKVFVRDGEGYMNRTNQRPFVFKIRQSVGPNG